ncbi:MAG: hypothetical protein COV72_04760 [Candidatus Omnitrophica bacterium CG11_big_fil_rev_8_21_14_0_20_42_13]|uniref:4-alpha-glucanotransferase n=1 Tax=Candidatus Ghiorseimicrobium undicola TaxID=1974746 RepID=A0A2H0LXG0_9BACT|nr:MAG: hypothetical protein COV72_04760 [Candidatus Omnitrophica bacterium CG11_big_fil_rev_8_21_14_0_20_42_13]
MGKVYFIFGVHNHQPTGNFEHVFKQAYDSCYFPFISTLCEFPRIKFSIHNSGCLYDWIGLNHPEYMERLKKMNKAGRIEVISGGYYEPILPLILDSDKQNQIKLMNEFIKSKIGSRPGGLWLTERVWEQYLARTINSCGLNYTFLDDTHFRWAGLTNKEFFGYYTTEDNAMGINVFPISKALRYKIPFSKPEEAIKILEGFAQSDDILITLFDDGEKFGLWPHTYEWVYEKEWLRRFLSLLDKSPLIETILPRDAVKKFKTEGIVYFPAASYEEMGEWVLEPEDYFNYAIVKDLLQGNVKFSQCLNFLRGGTFRNFYRKYPRLNYMHKRMLNLSEKINRDCDYRKDKKIFHQLWKAQTNCGYWHGVFGGFYLGHIRASIYENIIRAENLYDAQKSTKEIIFSEEDIDFDGNKEAILKNKEVICCFSRKGASLLELSWRGEAINLVNTVTRRPESYHKKIREKMKSNARSASSIHEVVTQKDGDLDKFLIYDKYARLMLVDHFLDKNLTLDSFNKQNGVFTLSNEVYDFSAKKKTNEVILGYRHDREQVSFSKEVYFSKYAGFDVRYKFDKKNYLNIYDFGIEFNISLPSLDDLYLRGENMEVSLVNQNQFSKLSSFSMVDNYRKVCLDFSFSRADIFTMPLYSVSSSESGFEKVYQQLVFVFILKDERNDFDISLRLKKIK